MPATNKEVAGLVLGVESGLPKERLGLSLQLKSLAVCAPAHKAGGREQEPGSRLSKQAVVMTSPAVWLLYVC